MAQVFINIVGHNASGKTTLAKKLEEDFKLSRVSGDDFRLFVHEHVSYFEGTDMAYPNQRYSELNPLVIEYRLRLTTILLEAGQNVLYDGSGATKDFRRRYLQKVASEFPTVKKVIIWA